MNKIKNIIRNVIQYFLSNLVFFLKREEIVSKFKKKIFQVHKHHIFFGYYDKSPIDEKKTKLLALKIPKDPPPETIASIGYFDINDGNSFHEIENTTLWNWQQGARLMWHPQKNNTIIFNKLLDKRYCTIFYDIQEKKIINIYSEPNYDISADGKTILSLNFHELSHLRPGYGYAHNPCPHSTEQYIKKIDTESNEIITILTAQEIHKIIFKSNDQDPMPFGYFNHISLNPSGNRFIFYYILESTGVRQTYAITSDLSGEDIRPLGKSGLMSHYTWISDNEILIFAKHNGVSGFYLFKDSSENAPVLYIQKYHEDGHPSFFEGHSQVLLDTYPSKFSRTQSLFFISKEGDKSQIAHTISPLNFTGSERCDLHPRLITPDLIVCDFPSFRDSVRKMCILNFDNKVL